MVYCVETYGKQVLGVRENDMCFSAAELFLAYGLGNGLYFPFGVGATAVYMPVRPTPPLSMKPFVVTGRPCFSGSPPSMPQCSRQRAISGA